jgi:hypothetical protein
MDYLGFFLATLARQPAGAFGIKSALQKLSKNRLTVLTLDFKHAITDRPATTAALFEHFGEL